MIRIGLRAHDYGRLPPEQLANTLAEYTPASIQLALAKAFPHAPPPGGLSPGYARHIREVFEARGIAVAVLGCYINPVHPDPEERNAQLRRFEEHLQFARDFGCGVVGTETGSCSPDCSWHPDTQKPETFDRFCASLEWLITTAEKCGAVVGIEPVAHQHTVDSIERMGSLLARFPSPALKVIYDPVNLIPLGGLEEEQSVFFDRALKTFGEHIVAVHAKDFRMEQGKKRGDLPSGTGLLDYTALLTALMRRKPGIDILLENSIPAQAQNTIRFLRETAGRISV